jgi:predicted RNA-binding protein (virulence factor B family)
VVRRSGKGEGSFVDVGLDKDAHIPQASKGLEINNATLV